mmetsp:Transcript_79776/g.247853  ORF Transcript_79776/g.247853 Transcript_79776/m.247853 type:complete len:294 (-) Transcript_79776:180-1061(-)
MRRGCEDGQAPQDGPVESRTVGKPDRTAIRARLHDVLPPWRLLLVHVRHGRRPRPADSGHVPEVGNNTVVGVGEVGVCAASLNWQRAGRPRGAGDAEVAQDLRAGAARPRGAGGRRAPGRATAFRCVVLVGVREQDNAVRHGAAAQSVDRWRHCRHGLLVVRMGVVSAHHHEAQAPRGLHDALEGQRPEGAAGPHAGPRRRGVRLRGEPPPPVAVVDDVGAVQVAVPSLKPPAVRWPVAVILQHHHVGKVQVVLPKELVRRGLCAPLALPGVAERRRETLPMRIPLQQVQHEA